MCLWRGRLSLLQGSLALSAATRLKPRRSASRPQPPHAATRANPAAGGCMLGTPVRGLSAHRTGAGQGSRARTCAAGCTALLQLAPGYALEQGQWAGACVFPRKAMSCAGRAAGHGSMQHIPWEGCTAAQRACCTQTGFEAERSGPGTCSHRTPGRDDGTPGSPSLVVFDERAGLVLQQTRTRVRDEREQGQCSCGESAGIQLVRDVHPLTGLPGTLCCREGLQARQKGLLHPLAVSAVDNGHVVMLLSAPFCVGFSGVDGAMLRALHQFDANVTPAMPHKPAAAALLWLGRSATLQETSALLHWGTVESGCCEKNHSVRTTSDLRDICVMLCDSAPSVCADAVTGALCICIGMCHTYVKSMVLSTWLNGAALLLQHVARSCALHMGLHSVQARTHLKAHQFRTCKPAKSIFAQDPERPCT